MAQLYNRHAKITLFTWRTIFYQKTTIQTRFMTLHNKARSLFTIAKQRERAQQ